MNFLKRLTGAVTPVAAVLIAEKKEESCNIKPQGRPLPYI